MFVRFSTASRHTQAHFQAFPTMDIFIQQIINGLILGSIYALVALGYTMVYGIMGLIRCV